MLNGVNSMSQATELLENAQDSQDFQFAVNALRECLKKLDVDSECLIGLERRAYYLPNDYSNKDTKSKMLEAKKRVMEYRRNPKRTVRISEDKKRV